MRLIRTAPHIVRLPGNFYRRIMPHVNARRRASTCIDVRQRAAWCSVFDARWRIRLFRTVLLPCQSNITNEIPKLPSNVQRPESFTETQQLAANGGWWTMLLKRITDCVWTSGNDVARELLLTFIRHAYMCLYFLPSMRLKPLVSNHVTYNMVHFLCTRLYNKNFVKFTICDMLIQGCPTFRLRRAALIASLAWRVSMEYQPLSRRCLYVNFNNVIITPSR